jgi:hypothetical protein
MTAKKIVKHVQNNTTAAKVGIGIGLTAAAVAAAGAYFLLGSKHAAQNRKKMKGWTLKAKGEVLEALEKAERVSAAEYLALVDTASKAYGTVERATKGELKDFKSEMLGHWDKLQKNKLVMKVGEVKAAAAKKAPVKTAAKKAAKKVLATVVKKS